MYKLENSEFFHCLGYSEENMPISFEKYPVDLVFSSGGFWSFYLTKNFQSQTNSLKTSEIGKHLDLSEICGQF